MNNEGVEKQFLSSTSLSEADVKRPLGTVAAAMCSVLMTIYHRISVWFVVSTRALSLRIGFMAEGSMIIGRVCQSDICLLRHVPFIGPGHGTFHFLCIIPSRTRLTHYIQGQDSTAADSPIKSHFYKYLCIYTTPLL